MRWRMWQCHPGPSFHYLKRQQLPPWCWASCWAFTVFTKPCLTPTTASLSSLAPFKIFNSYGNANVIFISFIHFFFFLLVIMVFLLLYTYIGYFINFFYNLNIELKVMLWVGKIVSLSANMNQLKFHVNGNVHLDTQLN